MINQGDMRVCGAFVYYTKIAKPALKYEQSPVKGKPFANREYSVDVLVTEEDFSTFKKRYKTSNVVKSVKELDAKEFEEKFKVAPPYEADTYYILKFKKSADYKDGNPTDKPKVVGKKGSGISSATELGNGTKANVHWREREWSYGGKKGLSLDLSGIAVIELVEYTKGASIDFGDEFEEIEDNSTNDFGDEFEEIEEDSHQSASEDDDDSGSW